MNLEYGDLVWIPADTTIQFVNSRIKNRFVVRQIRTSKPSTGLFLRESSGIQGKHAVVFRHGEEVRINPNYIRKMEG